LMLPEISRRRSLTVRPGCLGADWEGPKKNTAALYFGPLDIKLWAKAHILDAEKGEDERGYAGQGQDPS